MPPEDVCGISRNFSRLSPCEGQVAYALLTRAPVADGSVATSSLPLDLHVLSLSLAFILSQDQTLRCLSCSFIFLCHSDSQTNNLGSSRHLRYSFSWRRASALFLRLVSLSHHFNVLCAVSFSESGYKGTAFIFNRQIFRELFFQVSFSEPRVRAGPTPSGITPKLHDHRSVSLLRLQRYCLLPFPPNFSASFFAPFFQLFSQHIDSPLLISETFFTPFSFFCDRHNFS